MFDARAALLHEHAIEALSDLRTWIWGRHAELLPEDLASISRADAERYAAYLDWYSRVEEVLLALAASAAAAQPLLEPTGTGAAPAGRAPTTPGSASRRDEELLAAPTVRAPSSYAPARRNDGWQPVIAVLSTFDALAATPGSKAA